MKHFAVLIFLFAASLISAQQAQIVEAFRKLTTTAQRFAFLADSNVVKMDKPAYDAILPVIEAKKDDKTLFFWHFQYMRFAEQFKIFNDEMFPTILENMSNAAAKRGLDVESVVAQYHIAFKDFGSKKLSEQQVYSAFIHCFEKIKRLGIDNFRPYSIDQILLQIGGNFYALGDYDKALECLLEAENLNKSKDYSSPHIHTLILNLIQSIYADAKNYPKAIAYAEKIYDLNSTRKYDADHTWFSTFWQGLSSLDIALYLFEMGKGATAICAPKKRIAKRW
jgi:tetratricopeptide (TPR) repeat protein